MSRSDPTLNPFAVRFGLNLARARKAAGISQELLGDLAMLHRTAVGQLERGERVPRSDTLVKLAASLECEPSELLAGIDYKPSSMLLGCFKVGAMASSGEGDHEEASREIGGAPDGET